MDRSFTFPNASDNAEDTGRCRQQSSRGSQPAADSATPSNTTASASNPRRRAILGSGNWRQTAAPPAGSPILGPRTESTNLGFAAVTSARGQTVAPRASAPVPARPAASAAVPTLPSIIELSGNMAIFITRERAGAGAGPNAPAFLAQFTAINNAQNYHNIVLPHVAGLLFVLESNPDITFFHKVLESPRFPSIHTAITKLAFPGFFWFSGIQFNRMMNPALAFASELPNLHQLTLRFNTGGLTISCYGEKERMEIERTGDLERSKLVRMKTLAEVSDFYDLCRIFECKRVKVIHLECIDSPHVRYFCRNGDPLKPFKEMEPWMTQGFQRLQRRAVAVDLRIVEVE